MLFLQPESVFTDEFAAGVIEEVVARVCTKVHALQQMLLCFSGTVFFLGWLESPGKEGVVKGVRV